MSAIAKDYISSMIQRLLVIRMGDALSNKNSRTQSYG
jgi:hypothetical protein